MNSGAKKKRAQGKGVQGKGVQGKGVQGKGVQENQGKESGAKGNRMKENGTGLLIGMTAVLMILAGLHFLDARAGVLETGDTWLLSRYGMVVAAAAGTALLLGRMLLGRGSVKENSVTGRVRLETCFLASAFLFGMISMYVLPPLSAPDEVSHYISAYRISNRLLGLPAFGSEDNKVLIREEDWFAEDSGGDFRPYVTAAGELATDEEGAEDAEVLGQVLVEETYRRIHEKGLNWSERRMAVWAAGESDAADAAQTAGNTGNGTALSNHHPVKTTPAAYFVPALGITLARLLGLNSLGVLYLGRIFNLLLFVMGTYLAMRRLPFGKEILFGVALLPMTIHLSASYSYDAMVMAGIFYFTAVCLQLAFEAERVRIRDVAALALIMAAVGPCKMVYTVFMGLCLLIPVKKFGKWRRWLLAACCVLGAWLIAMVLINGQTVAAYATEMENFIDWAGEPGFSLALLIHQPVRTIQMFYNTVVWQAEHYHQTMIGAYLGNVDLVLDVPYVVVMFYTVGLLGLTFRKPGETLVLTGGKRIWIWVLCFGCAAAIMTSMLLAWTPLSSKTICGVQGRYFLPFLPLLLMTWKNDTIVLTKNADRSILYLMCCAEGYVLFRLFAVVCMRI